MNSISRRFLFYGAGFLLVFLGLTGAALDLAFRSSARDAVVAQTQVRIYNLLSVAELEPDGLALPPQLPDPAFNQLNTGVAGFVTDSRGNIIWRSPSAIELALGEWASLTAAPGQAVIREPRLNNQAWFVNSFGSVWEDEQNQEQTFIFHVAQDQALYLAEVSAFRQALWQWLGLAVVVLALAQSGLVLLGLRPVRNLAEEVAALEQGQLARIEGHYPQELEPLKANMNALIQSERQQRERYKNTLADLAHSLKTPLAVVRSLLPLQADDHADSLPALNASLNEQVERMDGIVAYQLKRAVAASRAATREGLAAAPFLQRLTQSLQKVYPDRHYQVHLHDPDQALFFGDESDWMELTGNLIDNAFKYGRGRVSIELMQNADGLTLAIADDGPGLSETQKQTITGRGVRQDSQTPGQGIGLAVVADIVATYGGQLQWRDSDWGGLCVQVFFPRPGTLTGNGPD